MLRTLFAGVVLAVGLHASRGEVQQSNTAKGLALLAAMKPKAMLEIEKELAQRKHVAFLAVKGKAKVAGKAKVKSAAELQSEYKMREEKALHRQHEGKTGLALFARAQQVFDKNLHKNLAKKGLSPKDAKRSPKMQESLKQWRAKALQAKLRRMDRRAQKKKAWLKAHPKAAASLVQKKQQMQGAPRRHKWRGRKHQHHRR
eukprot:TRINITY_DN578_c0_g1_i1.p1 TRINITY_DN578_c0_g1~~TRINITY_DN578_c0_g1_i1.p1  ORF type:complete len:201 (+),score=61.66 TRINITY_DN578_c0_g1_i1:140-742(+)